MNIKSKLTQVISLCNRAISLSNNDTDKALTYGLRALGIVDSGLPLSKQEKLTVYITLQKLYFKMASYIKSYTYGNRALSLVSDDLSDINMVHMSEIFRYQSLSCNMLGCYDKEYSLSIQSYNWALKTRNYEVQHKALTTLAFCTIINGDYKEQLKLLSMANDISIISKDIKLQSRTANNFSLIYISIGDFNKAEEYLSKCLEICPKDVDLNNFSNYLFTKASLAFGKKENIEALKNFKRVLTNLSKIPCKDLEFKVVINISKIYKKQGKYKEALSILLNSLHSFNAEELSSYRSKISLELSRNYELLDDEKNSLKYLQIHCKAVEEHTINRQLFCKENKKEIILNDILKTESEIMREKNKRQKKELYKISDELEKTQDVTLQSILGLIETRCTETTNHIKRTMHYMKALAELLKDSGYFLKELSRESISYMVRAAQLHDIGKIGIPDNILFKPEKLTKQEFNIMKSHTTSGYTALKKAKDQIGDSTFLKYSMDIAHTHHEKWDGTGYPNSLEGQNIPLAGRIMAVIDVYDALVTKRSYKEPIPHVDAVKQIKNGSGTFFDPDIVQVFIDNHERFNSITIELFDHSEDIKVNDRLISNNNYLQ